MGVQKGMACFLILSMVISPSISTTDNAGIQSLTSANTDFGHTIFQKIGSKYDNLVFSPYSLHSALTMTSNGAVGETLQEMQTTLKTSNLTETTVNQAYMDLISSYNSTGDVDVLTGNAIFQNPRYTIEQAFKDLVADKYFATAQLLNFSAPGGAEKMVNDYVAEKTNDMIEDLLAKDTLSEGSTKLVLVNTIFFNGSWINPFEKLDTKKEPFHVSDSENVDVDMMTQEESFQMKFTDGYKSLRLPFTGNRFALYIVVPKSSTSIHNPLCLPQTAPGEYFTDLVYTRAKVSLPKFEINYRQSLKELLQELGMAKAFSDSANFDRMSPGSRISDVIHQAVIEVRESGTTAAAATVVIMVETSLPLPSNIEFRVDQPFLFYLRDDHHGEILFQGKYARPPTPPATSSDMVEEVQRTPPQCPTDVGDGGDGAVTLSLAVFGWILTVSFSLFHLTGALRW